MAEGRNQTSVFVAVACAAFCATSACAPSMIDPGGARPIADFRPSSHGYAFRNSFAERPLSFGWADRYIPWPTPYGLCGGMSLAAADYFLAARSMPGTTEPPTPGSGEFAYIMSRQVESMGFLGWRALRFAQWMAMPDHSARGTFRRTMLHWPTTRARLDAGEPAPLGLVYTSFRQGGVLWENHQVLATSWRADALGVIDITVYDPNYPGRDDVRIRLTPVVVHEAPGARDHDPPVPIMGYSGERIVPGLRPKPVRGMFAMGYTPRTPPQ